MAHTRRAFTLVELLVVITIIIVLAGLSLGGLNAARESARVTKTRTTIAKLDQLVQSQYESYMTRRVTFYQFVELPPGSGNWEWVPVTSSTFAGQSAAAQRAAASRLFALRELMRMEMPDRFSDFLGDPPTVPIPLRFAFDPVAISTQKDYYPKWSLTGNFCLCRPDPGGNPVLPNAAKIYRRKYANRTPSGDYGSAECLHLWITTLIPAAKEQFMANEIGDADSDGWPEFIDAWGNPIKFLRWAPGFEDSDIQTPVCVYDSTQDKWVMDLPIVLQKREQASREDHDPFDPRKVDLVANPGANYPPRGWRLMPLVYSAGPDGIYGINVKPSDDYSGNPFAVWDGSNWQIVEIGRPLNPSVSGEEGNQSATGPSEASGPFDHQDNIHNHRTEVR